MITPLKKLLYSVVSLTNAQSLASRLFSPSTFTPSIFVPRLAHGAHISMDEASRLIAEAPSLESKPWTEYWEKIGRKFEKERNYQAATLSYIMGCFPKEEFPWKDEINELKRQSFQKWCQEVGAHFEERIISTPYGKIRYYLAHPSHKGGPTPLTIFVNGLEGSAEELAFPLLKHLQAGMGFAAISVPGSADYDAPMTTQSDLYLRCIIDDICLQPWVDKSRLGMVGFSFGAYWTFICAKTDARIKFSLCNGMPYLHTFSLARSYGLNPIISHALLCMFRLRHPLQLLGRIKILAKRAEQLMNAPSGPILFINGDGDTIVDPRDTELAAKGQNHKLIWLKNDDHCGLFHYERMVSVVVGWSKRCLSQI